MASSSNRSELNRKAVAAHSIKKKEQGYKVVKIYMNPDNYAVYKRLLDNYTNSEELMADMLALFDVTINSLGDNDDQ